VNIHRQIAGYCNNNISGSGGHCKRYRAGVNADLTPSTGGPVGHACR